MNNTFYIETMGCQMNKLDSELIFGQLVRLGFQNTDIPEKAGIIIFNTCSVRQHAEDKVISKIGQLRRRHQEHPEMILAIVGCMAQRLGQDLLNNHQQVDIVCGPGQLHQLSSMVREIHNKRTRLIALNDTATTDEPLEKLDSTRRHLNNAIPFQAYVRISRGCNNYCSYCIVPYVRGPERSRPTRNIIDESRRLVDNGVKEITLLGQTVNSYQYKENGKVMVLADLLEKLHDIPDLKRLRFVTSYPRHFDKRLFQAMAALPKVCPYLHLCAQSGSDRILKAMNRHYSVRQYLDIIERGREMVPQLTVAGDFIVGFPGEQEDDFQMTMDLVRKVRYKNCFIFKYSPRPGTRAEVRLQNDIPDEVKKRRNTELLALQNEIALQDNQQFVGNKVEVMVEGPSKKPHLDKAETSSANSSGCQLAGRTPGDHIVVFDGSLDLAGEIIPVTVTKASALTLFAKRYTHRV